MPSTLLGSTYLVVACIVTAWIVVFVWRLFLAPGELYSKIIVDRDDAKRSISVKNDNQPDLLINELFRELSSDVLDAESKMWQQVGREIRDKLSLGEIHSWGREVGSGRQRAALAPIEDKYWKDAEFTYLFFPEGREQLTHVRNPKSGVEYADLRFRQAEIKSVKWPEFVTNDKKFVRLQLGAQDVYVHAKELDHYWCHCAHDLIKNTFYGVDEQDRLLNVTARLMATQFHVYGKPPLATERERIEVKDELGACFFDYARKYSCGGVTWTDPEISLAELNSIMKWLERGDALKGSSTI